jgi:hypothetical protein
MFLIYVLLAAVVIWVTYGYGGRRTSFLPDFGRLLELPELADGFSDRVAGRSLLKGEFRGRNVVIVLQHGTEDESPILVLSMETHAPPTMETYDFAGYKADREGELALFALEIKHQMKLRHRDGYLKAQCYAPSLGFFAGVFDSSKWQTVLEAMDTLARSIEQRASSSTVSAVR